MSGAWRVWAGAVALAMTGAIVWPIVPDEDGFTLSNYPMFSTPKTTTAKTSSRAALRTETQNARDDVAGVLSLIGESV